MRQSDSGARGPKGTRTPWLYFPVDKISPSVDASVPTGWPKKVSHYQIIKKCVKSYQSLPMRLDFFVKLKLNKWSSGTILLILAFWGHPVYVFRVSYIVTDTYGRFNIASRLVLTSPSRSITTRNKSSCIIINYYGTIIITSAIQGSFRGDGVGTSFHC